MIRTVLMLDDIFATPRQVARTDCHFYHVLDIPGVGPVAGNWDLRRGVDEYLGHVDFAGKRVLEIGPASGFLTMEMEKRGADVIAVEMPEEPGWDYVPYPAAVLAPVMEARRAGMQQLKNGFWFNHAAHNSRAKVIYAEVAALPPELGRFDIALLGSVLLHCANPLQLITECAKRADTLIITDIYYPELEGSPVCRLHPSVENKDWGTWWDLSTDLLIQFLQVLGFSNVTRSLSSNYLNKGHPRELFTLVATRWYRTARSRSF
jgi:SAM-dependent methyltransferase